MKYPYLIRFMVQDRTWALATRTGSSGMETTFIPAMRIALAPALVFAARIGGGAAGGR